MKTVILIAFALAAAAGCDRAEGKATGAEHPSMDSKPGSVDAENTKKNERDRAEAALTPGDQGESDADRSITQSIRQAVVKDDALSFTAKNIKIITVDGVVTLRGPVKSDKEKTDIGALAQQVNGIKRVDNQLEVATN
jgi:osmotically-inducible protein OsmY